MNICLTKAASELKVSREKKSLLVMYVYASTFSLLIFNAQINHPEYMYISRGQIYT